MTAIRRWCPLQRRTGGEALSALTAREPDVLPRMAQGRSDTEIAAELFLSEPTVTTYVCRILATLQLRDRVHALVLADDSGLVRPGRGRAGRGAVRPYRLSTRSALASE